MIASQKKKKTTGIIKETNITEHSALDGTQYN